MRYSSNNRIVRFLLITAFVLAVYPQGLFAAEVEAPDVKLKEGDIYVSTLLVLDDTLKYNINKGITKEVVFYIDLFRVWKNWPDEFVIGKKITRTIKCDPVKKEYVGTSFDGSTLLEKRFSSCKPLLEWLVSIGKLKLTNVKGLEPSNYFIKVTVESSRKSVPRFIAHLFFFLPKKEFNTSSNSKSFAVGGAK